MVLPTVDNIEQYLQQVEDVVFASVSSATADLPSMRQALQRLQEDLARFWPQALPQLPEIKIPNLGAFEVPPPPPLPPVPKSTYERSADWIGAHPWKASGLGIGLVGAGLLVGYAGSYYLAAARTRRVRTTSLGTDRRQVVVVLGGDSALGIPLILELEKQGYIVITSVCTPEAVHDIESQTHGYVRAIVLDPSEPATIPYFLRSLSSTLSRRFPITSSGDPHSSPATQPYVHSVISLLTLPPPHLVPLPGPLENVGMQDSYPAYLQATHFTPFQVFQALLPLIRNSPTRAKKSIIVCLPATDGRVGLPFAGAQAMSAAATLRGAEILRREIRVAAVTESREPHTRSMKNIKVVVVDVGNIAALHSHAAHDHDLERAMIDWTASEKATYGAALANTLGGAQLSTSLGRKQTDVSHFVHTLIDIVSHGKKGPAVTGLSDLELVLGRLRQWIRGDRVAVGAGARTYAFASKLPSMVLDGLLTLPHILLSIRNALLLGPPQAAVPYPPPVPPTPASGVAQEKRPAQGQPVETDLENEMGSDTGSDADIESSSGYVSSAADSWISLQKDLTDQAGFSYP